MSEEVFQIRDQLVQLANTTYNGSYLYSGLVSGTPAYSAATYTNGSGESLERYTYVSADGSDQTRTIRISDSLTVTENTPGSEVFDGAIQALERLGRSLAGFRTEPAAVNGSNVATPTAPDGTGTAYDLSLTTERAEQTEDILNAMQLIDLAKEGDIIREQTNLAGRMKRLESTKVVLDLANTSLKEVLSTLQDSDIVDAASKLSLAQSALEASYSVTGKVLNLSILNYL
jgi:flagellin-like hook-associated protein FlgL